MECFFLNIAIVPRFKKATTEKFINKLQYSHIFNWRKTQERGKTGKGGGGEVERMKERSI